MKAKLTVRRVEAVQPGASDVIIWDSELTGFGCKVTPKGRRSYFLYYRTREGQQRRPTIGLHGPLRPEAAREIAKRWLAEVAQGRDPSQQRSNDRSAPNVRHLCDRYLAEHAEIRKKESSIRSDKRLIGSHLLPAIGAKKVASITREDIAKIHHSLRETPYEANRTLALSSKMFSLAERWGLRPDNSNPSKNIDRYKEEKRERFLSSDEVARLWRVLNSGVAASKVSASALAAIKLLMLTGRRLNEVLKLEWAWVDLEAKVLRLPDTKSGALLVSLGEPAIEVLNGLKATNADKTFVIVGKRNNAHLVNLQKPWRLVCEMAELEDVRLHDLRHTFASVGAGMGLSLHMLGRLLGHKQAETTTRYAHLAQDPVRTAADAIGLELLRLASFGQPIESKGVKKDQ